MNNMNEVILRFVFVYTLVHIILFFVELYRYKHSTWSWHDFKKYGMLDITYFVGILDKTLGFLIIVGWILQPLINK